MLLQAATSAGGGDRNSLLGIISQNLLKLLAFRRFAVLAEDSDRNKLFYKDKATSAAVFIAQMKNSNYLKRNSLATKK